MAGPDICVCWKFAQSCKVIEAFYYKPGSEYCNDQCCHCAGDDSIYCSFAHSRGWACFNGLDLRYSCLGHNYSCWTGRRSYGWNTRWLDCGGNSRRSGGEILIAISKNTRQDQSLSLVARGIAEAFSASKAALATCSKSSDFF